MTGSLGAAAVARFGEDGFLFPHRVVASEEAARVASQVLAFAHSDIPRHYPDPQNQLYLLKAHLLFDWADRLSRDARLLDAVESLIGPDILLWSSGVFWKSPRSGSFVSWHQDATNYALDRTEGVVRAWLSLTPATLANGTMRFMRGGHRLGQVTHVDRMRDGELLSRGETMQADIDEATTVPVIVDAGEVSFHHLHAPHASGANASDLPRVNYVMTFLAPEVRPLRGPDSAMRVRGEDVYRHFIDEPRPQQFLGEAALQGHQRFIGMRYPILFRGTQPPPVPVHDPRVWSAARAAASAPTVRISRS